MLDSAPWQAILTRPTVRRNLFGLLLMGLLAACGPIVPATVPPQVAQTPATAFITVERDRIHTDAFSLTYPAGWRVVKSSVADTPLTLVLVSPDDAQQIVVSAAPIPPISQSPDNVPHVSQATAVLIGETVVYLRGNAPADQRASFNAAFRLVWRSFQGR